MRNPHAETNTTRRIRYRHARLSARRLQSIWARDDEGDAAHGRLALPLRGHGRRRRARAGGLRPPAPGEVAAAVRVFHALQAFVVRHLAAGVYDADAEGGARSRMDAHLPGA